MSRALKGYVEVGSIRASGGISLLPGDNVRNSKVGNAKPTKIESIWMPENGFFSQKDCIGTWTNERMMCRLEDSSVVLASSLQKLPKEAAKKPPKPGRSFGRNKRKKSLLP